MVIPSSTIIKKPLVAAKKVPWYDKGHLKVSKGSLLDGRCKYIFFKIRSYFSNL